MDRRGFLNATLATAAVAVPLVRPRRPTRPDVLIVIGGDFGWRDVTPHVRTPTIAQLERRGMTLRKAFSYPAGGLTAYTVLFGRHPRRSGIDATPSYYGSSSVPDPDPALVSLPKILREAGYATGLFGKWNLGKNDVEHRARTPHLHGFDTWRAGVPGVVVQGGGTGYRNWLRVDDGVERMERTYQTAALRDAWLDWWGATEGPKLAVCAFHVAHLPFHDPPPELLAPYPKGSRGIITPEQTARSRTRIQYEEMVGSLDTVLGQMLEHVSDETLVLFFSDNGTPVKARAPDQDSGKIKHTTFDGGVNVPMFVVGPGIGRGTCSSLVSTVDVLATVADLVDAPVPDGAAEDSLSFRALLGDPGRRIRDHVFAEDEDEAMVRTETHKLRRHGEGLDLYDLRTDPDESRPLDGGKERNADVLAALRRVLDDPLS